MSSRAPGRRAGPASGLPAGVARPWLWASLGAVLALSVLLGFREVYSPDIGYHMETGREILERGSVPHRDTFTWTVPGNPVRYMPWLFDVLAWLLYRTGGTLLLVSWSVAATLASFALLLLRSARRNGALSAWSVALLLVFALGSFWEVRPHVGSWLLLNLTLLVLEEHRRGRRGVVWALPAIQVAWVNLHSLYVLGVVAIAIHAVEELRRGRSADRRFLLAAAAACLAGLASPYGVSGFLYPLTQFGMLQPANVVKSETFGTAEFLTPFRLSGYTDSGRLVLVQPLLFVQAYASLALLAAAAGWRRLRLAEWLLLGAFGYVFVQAIKNHGYFVVATFPAVAGGLETAAAALRLRVAGLAGRLPRATGPAVLIATCMLLGVRLLNGYTYAHERSPHRIGHRFNERVLPVRACRFLAERVPAGRILNNWDAGGYLRFATRRPVFVDGRTEVLGDAFYAEYIRFKSADRIPELLARWRPEIVLVPFNKIPVWFHYFRSHPEAWRCVYADDQDAIFLAAGFAPEIPALPPPRPGADHPTYMPAETDAILARGDAIEEPGLLASVFGRHHEPREELARMALYLLRGFPEAAVGWGLRGLETSTFPAPEILVNLGHAFFALGDTERAARCYEAFLRNDRDETAEKRLARIRRR